MFMGETYLRRDVDNCLSDWEPILGLAEPTCSQFIFDNDAHQRSLREVNSDGILVQQVEVDR